MVSGKGGADKLISFCLQPSGAIFRVGQPKQNPELGEAGPSCLQGPTREPKQTLLAASSGDTEEVASLLRDSPSQCVPWW